MPQNPLPPRHAFTLVELLVVIGIIAVLIGILLPTLKKARAAADQAACASSIRQICLAGYNYSVDNKSFCPTTTSIVGPTETINGVTGNLQTSWAYASVSNFLTGKSVYVFERGFLGKYLKTVAVMECPTMKPLDLPVADIPSTYAMTVLKAQLMSQIRVPAETPMIVDAITLNKNTGALTRPTTISPPSANSFTFDPFHGRHAKGVGNVGFFDGHVDAIPVQLRPKATYSQTHTDAAINFARINNVGPLYPKPIDFSPFTDSASYVAKCTSDFDYYFWLNKDRKLLTYK